MARWKCGIAFLTILVLLGLIVQSECACKVPKFYQGDWYSREQGKSVNTLINDDQLLNLDFNGTCFEMRRENRSVDAKGRYHSEILFLSGKSGCFKCYKIFFRTVNVLQYSVSTCETDRNLATLDNVCGRIQAETEVLTMFKKDPSNVNCKTTFEGVYHFTYEENFGGGGICKSPNSHVIACQEPGSPYVDNQVFNMNFGKCRDVDSSYNKRVRFKCLGTWYDGKNVWSAMADDGEEVFRDRFKCLLTSTDQQRADNTKLFSMSRWAECSTLITPYDGDIRLILLPVVYGDQLVQPSCNLPRNFTGTWFTTGEFDTQVVINATHIYYKTKIDEFTYRETYFTCQQNRDSRFLMTAVTVGKCEVDYVCFDFLPRHHNIIRWRMGKPYRALDLVDVQDSQYLQRKFRQACSWYSFTLDRTQTDWTYNVYILDPPAPVECPIAGRYKFTQNGAESEKYITRVRGITVRPRHQIDCRIHTSEIKSCSTNTNKIYVDVDYCDTVDHTGRPIGEYDIEDNALSCVGFWMEDMRSYMITYDEEDAVSRFRCWVYERLDWRDIIMSRATRAICGKTQTARSYRPEEGASLFMELKEAERLFDDCPQRYNDGSNPYASELKVFVMGSASTNKCSLMLIALLVLMTVLSSLR